MQNTLYVVHLSSPVFDFAWIFEKDGKIAFEPKQLESNKEGRQIEV
jgi:hypothetical protein